MEQTYVVAGYFASRAAAGRALTLLNIGPAKHRLVGFGSASAVTEPLERLASAWLRPDEWLLTVQLAEREARQVFELLQRSGEAVHVGWLSPALTQSVPPDGASLRERWQWSLGVISSVLKRQIDQAERGGLAQKAARWGITEADYENNLAGISLIEHRYILDGYTERLQALLKGTRYLQKLPVGEVQGVAVPLVYQLAYEAEHELKGKLNEDRLKRWLGRRCQELDLLRGEFKTIEPMLVVTLLEDLAVQIVTEQRREAEVRLARLAAVRIGEMPMNDLAAYWIHLHRVVPAASRSLASLLVELLRDTPVHQQGLAHLWDVPSGEMLAKRLRRLQRQDADRLERFNRVVTSLRLLARADWAQIIEDISPVTALLRQDPSDHFARMDGATRSWYADRVADIAKWSAHTERQVATALVRQAATGTGVARHIGYYLIDDGRRQFERQLRTRLPHNIRFSEWARRHPAGWYLGLLWFLTLVGEAIFIWMVLVAGVNLSWWLVALLAVVAVVPMSQLGVEMAVYITTRIARPLSLPKLRFPRGLPANSQALVVVPLLLRDEASVQGYLEQLEAHYLANPDAGLAFGLLSDFMDAPAETLASDRGVMEAATEGLQDLQQRYPQAHFFLFHRPRMFNEADNVWMGQERKRGKLEDFNDVLMKHGHTDWLLVGEVARLQAARFVITLDEDTELPPGSAKRMAETLAHPLNEPLLDTSRRRLEHGYGIIQPRVSPSLEASYTTRLARLLYGRSGIDPYMVSYSDLYHDLARDAIFHGKGIYEAQAFDVVLGGRLPVNRVLSHDLLEGSYLRVGLATDIMLFDTPPVSGSGLLTRQHRWVRGDWQIAAWLRRRVPSAHGPEANPLSPLNRWKIFDNLRRSLLPVAQMGLLVAGIVLGGTVEVIFMTFGLLPSFMPLVLQLPGVVKTLALLRRPDLGALGQVVLDNLNTLMLLPRYAWLLLDAILRVWYRLAVSHRRLLEWRTAADARRRSPWLDLQTMTLAIAAGGALVLVGRFRPGDVLALGLLGLWMLAPVIMTWLDGQRRVRSAAQDLTPADRILLRRVALQTWRYFDELMVKSNHFLPPDNLQVTLKLETAQRTSPTNIGLGLLSWLAAHDLGYATIDQVLGRLRPALKTLGQLDTYRGHIYNWYRTDTLEPLLPRYVSMVDSGNLMASLWTLRQGLLELSNEPIVAAEAALGWVDLVAELEARLSRLPRDLMRELTDLANQAQLQRHDPAQLLVRLEALAGVVLARATELRSAAGEPENFMVERFIRQAESWHTSMTSYLDWLMQLAAPPTTVERLLSSEFRQRRDTWLTSVPSLADLAAMRPEPRLIEREAPEVLAWWHGVEQSRRLAIAQAQAAIGRIETLAATAGQLADRIDMRFLYDAKRKTFHIGYNLEEAKLDKSFYDLLASEARLGSFTAIAAGQVPAEHWWALGRNSRRADGQPVLLSWSGTMFEYLMPRLMMQAYPGTLLQQGLQTAVAVQRRYGERLDIPWGISESGHSGLDYDNTYQYRAFGAPPLGIQPGLAEGVVVAPYASLLALAVDPVAAVANLRRLERQGLRGDMGFFEAVDYRRAATASGERGVGVFNYMAHHQAMGLLAAANVLGQDQFTRRFHADVRVRAARTLLHERPTAPGKSRQDVSLRGLAPLGTLSSRPVVESTAQLTGPLPRAHVLTNGTYTTMITTTGGGFTRWRNMEVNRWTADALHDEQGTYMYLREPATDTSWSATFAPTLHDDDSYRVGFRPEKAVFERKYQSVRSSQEVYIVPDHDVEVRWLRLRNEATTARELEAVSVLEFGMAPHEARINHPAFNKLFIGTEALSEQDGILAHRRARATTDEPVWVAHLLVNLTRPAARATLQTNKEDFRGRLSTLRQPVGLAATSDHIPRYPLDPIAAVTQRFVLEPGRSVELAALTITAATRQEVIRLANRYRQRSALNRARQVSWTLRQAELQRLQITEAEAQIFQTLASYLLYPNRYLKQAAKGLVAGEAATVRYADLPYGPSVIVAVDDLSDLGLARQIGLAHKYFMARGLHYPLVWLVKLEGEAGQRLTRHLTELAESLNWLGEAETKVDIRIWNLAELSDGVLQELISRARIVLDGSDGPLGEQLLSVAPLTRGTQRPLVEPATPQPLALPEHIEYHNGFGGFTDGGHAYTIMTSADTTLPAPWANVLANATFGSLVTERGGGFSWAGNSQQFRLTPWQNEPLTDSPEELIYVHDLETNRAWAPQPGYHGSGQARVTHAAGRTVFEGEYDGLSYHLTVFVPVGWRGPSNVRVQRLRLTNTSNRARRLRLTSYADWVLGADREHTQEKIITGWDDVDQVILAQNPAHEDYGFMVAFMAQNRAVADFTTDRTEFLGPVRGDELPHGLTAAELTGRIGTGLDPVGVLRSEVNLAAGAETELDYYLGAAASAEQAIAAVRKLREAGKVTTALEMTSNWWDDTLSAITVKTPAREVDIMLNQWLVYQVINGRMWGRTGYYQSSGAFGFRDQLQDAMSLVYARPEMTREQILAAAAHQFAEGDVQHWWMPNTTRGLRTRMTDDRLWLPLVVAKYVSVTGDYDLLQEQVPYLEAPPLAPGQMESYNEAPVSAQQGSILDHCIRAINISLTHGSHRLPLMGAGDWNDGLNRVGIEGRGESVWLGWFTITVLHQSADLLDHLGRSPKQAERWREAAKEYTEAIETSAWDGDWYLRAYYDDGAPLGSAGDAEARIDSLSQSWAVIAGTGNAQRRTRAIDAAVHQLVDHEAGIINLLTPAFDTSSHDPGYIKGYLPGTRENGGQYTHAGLWLTMALARLGRGEEATELLRLINPINHGASPELVARYQLEPYVMAGDVYSLAGQSGRGGWSWYTGSAGWMYQVWIEEVLGLRVRNGNQLEMSPCIDRSWPGFTLTYRYKSTTYTIEVTNPHNICRGVAEQVLDGDYQPRGPITLVDDGDVHRLEVRLGY